MRHYHNNARWLMWFAPFRVLSISAAYLVPFFLEKGLNQSQIFLLQSIFSVSYLLWEIPSGWLADRIGRARSIQLSVPFAVVGMVAYGYSDYWWQFVVCELLLAVANGLISGADKALLIDSLKAAGRENEFVRVQQRIDALGYVAIAFGVPLSLVLVKYWGYGAAIVADGLVVGLGGLFTLRLVEPPIHETPEIDGVTAWRSVRQLLGNRESRWLVALGIVLNTSTYLGFWLSAPYYLSVGLPVEAFGAVLAARSLLKAWLSHRFHSERHIKQLMATYVGLAGLPYLCMATGQVWLALALIGHDVVQSLHSAPLARRYNEHMNGRNRAMLNSVVGMVGRLCYAAVGPLAGLAVDRLGLQGGFVVLGFALSTLAAIAYWRIVLLGSFDKGR
jgi:MFS family permease